MLYWDNFLREVGNNMKTNCSVCGVEMEIEVKHKFNDATYYCEACFNKLFQQRLAELGAR